MFQENPDYQPGNADITQMSMEPHEGFLKSLATAHDAAYRERSGAVEWEMQREYDRQSTMMRDLGVDSQPWLGPESVRRLPRHLSGETGWTGEDVAQAVSTFGLEQPNFPEQSEIDAYDQRIEELRKKYPQAQFKTSREMWESVRTQAQEAAALEDKRHGTMMGKVGAFVGGVAGFMDPRAGLAPIATAAVSAPGTGLKAVGTEAVLQMGVQAATEIDDIEARRMLGLDASIQGSIERIGFAGLGGAAIRGTGEGFRAAGKRWFPGSATDPAPPRPDLKGETPRTDFRAQLSPEDIQSMRTGYAGMADKDMAKTRMGVSRVIDDLNEVTAKADSWDGPRPHDIRPETKMPEEVNGVRFSDDYTTRRIMGSLTVDERARMADPDTFRVYDRWLKKLEDAREDLRVMRGAQDEANTADYTAKATAIDTRIAAMDEEMARPKTSAKRRRTLKEEKATAMAEKAALGDAPRMDTPREAKTREWIQTIDTKMRDLAPQVGRAYARARGEFQPNAQIKEAVGRMVNEKRSGMTGEDAEAIVRDAKAQMFPERGDVSPSSPVRDQAAPGGIIEEASTVAKADTERYNESIEQFRASVKGLLKEENDSITIGTQKLKLNQKIEVPNADGEGSRNITIRELLEELEESDEGLKAMKTCSI